MTLDNHNKVAGLDTGNALAAPLPHDLYLEFFNSIPVACINLDAKYNITNINSIGSQLLGLQLEHITGKNISRYLSPISQSIFPHFIEGVKSKNKPAHKDLQFISKDGPFIDCNVEAKLIANPATKKNQIYLFFSPTAHHYANDNAQQHLERLELIYRQNSVNELAGIIAHELKNPLTVILNYINGCIRKLESKDYNDNDIIKALKTASQQSTRVNELILRLRNFQYQKALDFEEVSLNEMIDNVTSIIKNDIRDYKLEIQYRLIGDVKVKADKLYIEQLLLNLCRNAIDALRDSHTQDPLLIIEVNRLNEHALEVKIMDNGPGFSSEVAARLYDPYFTTKPYGIGIGLALSQSIAIAHGSKINSEINFFGGATFSFELKLFA